MNTKLAASCFLAGALMLPIIGYAADTDPPTTTKQFVKDSAITTAIKAKMTAAGLPSLIHISVDTDDKGAVTLSGDAPNQAAVDKAVSIAKGVKGVTSVDNLIKIYGGL